MDITVIGSGLVGSLLGPRLRADGHHVTGTTTTPARVDGLAEAFDEVRVLVGGDAAAVADALRGRDAVVVTAGPSAARAMTREDRSATYHDVLVATARNVVAATTDAHLVMLSSITVYGSAADHLGRVDEDSPVSTSDDPSPANFLAAESVYRDGAGARSCIFRCADITGEADPSIEEKVDMAHRVLGGSVPFGPDSLFYRVDVTDVVDAVAFALSSRLVGTYNLTHAERPATNRQVFDAIGVRLGHGPLEYRDELSAPAVPVSVERLRAAGFVATRSHATAAD
jgi:nucleoside-diphosphate-sugar epimerase